MERVELILGSHDYHTDKPTASEWREDAKDGKLFRIICIPDGMTLMDRLRPIGGYSESVLDRVAAAHPNPLVTGSVLMMRR